MNNKNTHKDALLPTSEIIARAKARGVDFGKGDPNNRIRYYTKINLLPHALRKETLEARKSRQTAQASTLPPRTEGHYPAWVVDKLVNIDKKLKRGKTIQQILREDAVESQPKTGKPKTISIAVATPTEPQTPPNAPATPIQPIAEQQPVSSITAAPAISQSVTTPTVVNEDALALDNAGTLLLPDTYANREPRTSPTVYPVQVSVPAEVATPSDTDSAENKIIRRKAPLIFPSWPQEFPHFPATVKRNAVYQSAFFSTIGLVLLGIALTVNTTLLHDPLGINNRVAGIFGKSTKPDLATIGSAQVDEALTFNPQGDGSVLAERTPNLDIVTINADTEIIGKLTAPNIIYSVVAGNNIQITEGQNPTISASFTEADTLATVTARGATTSTALSLTGGLTTSTLAVTGTATLSGALNVTGASTLTGEVTLSNTLNLGKLTSDPSVATNGSTYYNTTSNKFRCYQNSSWKDCITTDTTGGSMSSFIVAGTSGTNQTISDGNTLTIAAGNGVTTTAASTRTLTVGLDVTVSGAVSGETSAASGLAVNSDGLGLLRGCSNDQTLIWNSSSVVWQCGTSGSFNSFTAAGDTGTSQTISDSDTLTIAGGTNGIDTVASATDIITLNLDTTEIGTTTFGSGSGFTWTFDAGATDPTIAFASNQITIGSAATLSAAAVTAFNCTDCIDFDDIADSATLDASTTIGFGASTFNLTFTNNGSGDEIHNLSSTGDLIIQDNGTAFATFSDAGAITFAPPGTSDITFTTDSDSTFIITGLSSGSGSDLCIDASNNVVTCAAGAGGVGGSGTAGQIAFWSSGTAITSESSGFGWDSTNDLFTVTSGSTTGTVQTITANSLTTGTALNVTAASSPTDASSASQGVQLNLTQSAATNATTYTGLDLKFTNNPSVAGNTENVLRIQNQLTSNTTDNTVNALLLLDNADTSATGSTVVTDALRITNSGDISGGIVNGINIDDPDITTDIVLQNDETIHNDTDGRITFGGADILIGGDDILDSGATTRISLGSTTTLTNTTTTLSGTTTVTASSLATFTTAATLSMASTTTLNCADCIDFDDIADAMTLDASTSIGFGASTFNLTFTNNGSGDEIHNLSSTGDFYIQDNGTAVVTVADTGAITFAPTAGQNITLNFGTTGFLDINPVTYTNNTGAVDVARSGNFTGTAAETANDLRIAPSLTLTEPGSGTFTWYGANIDMSGIAVTAGAGTTVLTALRVAGVSDADAGTVNGIDIANLTATAATENALVIGSGWDNDIYFEKGSNDTILRVTAPGQATTITLPDPGSATANLCLSSGNCAGSGTGVTQSGTNANTQIAYFTSSNNITSASTFTIDPTATTGNTLTLSNTGLTSGRLLNVSATNTHTADAAIQQALFSLTNAQSTAANSNFVGFGVNFTNNPSVAGNTEYAARIQNQVTANTTDNAVAALLLLDNADTSATGSTVVTDALRITNSGAISGGVTNGIAFRDTTITNGLNFVSTPATNYVSGTNWSITAAGAETLGSNLTLAGNSSIIDMTGTGTLGINTTTNRAVSFGTGTTTFPGTSIVLSGSSPIIDLTSATTLSLNTTTNRPITTGSGLLTTGGALTATGLVTANAGVTLAADQDLTLTSGTGSIVVNNTVTNASDNAITITPSFTGGASDTLTYNILNTAAFSPTNAAGTDTVNIINIGNITDPGATITSNAIVIGSGFDNDIYFEKGTNDLLFRVTAPGQGTTITLPDPGASTANICLSSGNCAGSGSGVTQSGTNANTQIAYFTSSNNLTSASNFTINPALTTGTLFSLSSTASMTGTLTGQAIDLSGTTATNLSQTALDITLDGQTNTDTSGTDTYKGIEISGTALTQNGAGGTTAFEGIEVTVPAITGTAGTITADGLEVVLPASGAIVTGGTMNGIEIVAPTTSGPAAGTLNGINIGNLTSAGAATETALLIGSGWDNDIYFEKGSSTDVILRVTAASGGDRVLTIPQLSANVDICHSGGNCTGGGGGTGATFTGHVDNALTKFTTTTGQITASGLIEASSTLIIDEGANTANAVRIRDGTNSYFTVDTRTATSGVAALTLATGTAPTVASAATAYFNSSVFTPGTVNFSGSTQITSTGTSANNAILFNQPTINRTAAASNLTIDQAANLFINGATIASHATGGQTETITDSVALRIGAGSSLAGTNGAVTRGYGLYVDAPTGANSNYAATFASGNVGIGDTTPTALLTVGSGDLFQVSSAGLISTTPSSNSNALSITGTSITSGSMLTADVRNTSGTLLNLVYGGATTQAGDLVGQLINLNTNLTGAADQDVTGVNVQTPTLTSSGTATTTYTGYNISAAAALTQNTAAGTINWRGVNLTMPNITQTTGTITSSGVLVTNGTATTGGTQHMINLSAAGVGAGTLNGINVGAITAGAGTETAIAIGSGWDDAININSGTFIAETSGAIAIAPNTTGTFLDFALETEWTSGTLINADYASATTQASDIVGALLNFNTNLTGAADSDVTGVNVQTPALTSSGTATTNYDGYRISAAGALVQNTAAGTINWDGVDITMPNITQTTGTVTADGVSAANGTITTGGTQSIFHAVATGVGAGTLYGINIDNITGGSGTETAISVGSGWDTDIAFIDSSVVLDGPASSTLTLQDFVTLTASSLTTLNCADCIDFDDMADSMTVDAATDINLGANALTIDLDSTGDFSIRDVATDIATFADSGAITFAPTSGQNLTTTFAGAGLLDINLVTYTNNTGGVDIARGTNFTGTAAETAIDLKVAPSLTLTEPGSGTFTWYGANIDMSGIAVTAGAGTTVLTALRVAGVSDADAGTVNGIDIANLTATAATENALVIGSGWDNDIYFEKGSSTDVILRVTAASGADRVLTIPQLTANVDLCHSGGNCAGQGGVVSGTGTAGQIAFWSSSTGITSETSGFGWDSSNNLLTIAGVQPASVGTTPGTAASDLITLTTATGGNTTIATTGTGGIGQGLAWTLGTGGTAASANTASTGGAGGAYAITSGTGGAAAATGTNVGGAGGAVSLTGGAGGAASGGSSNTGGAGGAISITAGSAGSGGNANGGTLTLNSGAVTGTGTSTLNIATANTTALEIGDSTVTKTIDIGGVTSSAADTINIATNGTAADTLAIGNTNASTTLALTGGDDWSMAATGVLTLSASAAQTTAIVITDTDYTNAISLADNNITGTSYGVLASSALTLGDAATGTNAATVAIFSSDWEISTTGDMTGIGSITADGAISTTSTLNVDSTTTLAGTTLDADANLTFSSGTGSLVMTNTVTNASDQVIDIAPAFAGGATDALTYTVIDVAAFSPTNAAGTDTVNALEIGALTDPGATITSTALKIGSGWDSVLSVNGTTVINGSGQVVSTQVTGTLFSITDSSTTETIAQGNTITYADSSTINAAVSATDTVTHNVIANSLDFAHFENTLDVDAATDINLGANALTIDLDSTGDFSIRDVTTDIATFADSGAITFAPTSGEDVILNFAGNGRLDINPVTYETALGAVDVARSGNFTGTATETANDIRVAPSLTLTEPGSGTFTWYGANIDMSGIAVTAGAGTTALTALRVAGVSDADAGTVRGIDIANLTGTAATETALSIGTGWDQSIVASQAPTASATSSVVQLGSALAGASANGTYLGINAASGYAGEYFNFQENGTTQLHYDGFGLYFGNGDSNATFNISEGGTIRNMTSGGAAIAIQGTSIELEDTSNNDRFVVTTSNGDTAWTLAASGDIAINASSTANTTTAGVLDLNVNSVTANNVGLNIDYVMNDVTTAGNDLFAAKINLTANDADGDLFGLQIQSQASLNAAASSFECLLCLDNAENTPGAVIDGIRISSSGVAAGITNDLKLQNSETITNSTDGTVAISGTTFTLTEATTLTASSLATLTTGATLTMSGNLTVQGTTGLSLTGSGADISLSQGETITNDTNGTIGFTTNTAGTDTVASFRYGNQDAVDYGVLNIFAKAAANNPSTCTAGDIYVNSTSADIWACTSTDSWEQLDGAGQSTTLQNAYDNSTTPATITLSSTDDSLVFTNPTSSGTDLGYLLHLNQAHTTGAVSALDITQASSGADAVNLTANSIDTETALDIDANALTTGDGISIASTGTGLTSGSLLYVTSATTAAVATDGIVSLNASGNYTSTSNIGLLSVKADATAAGTIANISGDALTTGVGLLIDNGTSAMTTGSLLRVAAGGTGAVATNGLVNFVHSGAYTSTANVGFVNINASATTAGTVASIFGDALTTGTGLYTSFDALTTGRGFDLTSTSTALSSGNMLNLDWSPGSATTATGDLMRINIGTNGTTTGNLFDIEDTSSSIFSVSETQFSTSLPANFTAAGDVAIAYDINFTNPTASYIKSAAPLALVAGETFNSSDLTLQTYNSGSVVIDSGPTGTIDLQGAVNFGDIITLADDATPDVSAGSWFATGGTTTITDFDAGSGTLKDGHIIFIKINHTVTFTCTGSEIDCGFANIGGTADDLISFIYDATEDIWWLLNWFQDTDTQSGGADLAEYYVSSETLEPGDVVSIDTTQPMMIHKSTGASDNRSIGIISTQPGLVLGGSTGTSSYLVALQGHVPTKVSAENGPIQPGDYLTTSSTPGVAMKATRPGQTIGKALESYSDSGIGSIEVFINIAYADPTNAFADLSIDENGNMTVASLNAGVEVLTGQLTADEVVTTKLVSKPNEALTVVLSENGSFRIVNSRGEETFTIDENGNASFSGELRAGSIKADRIEGLEVLSDRIASLEASQSATGSAQLAFGFDEDNQEATISGGIAGLGENELNGEPEKKWRITKVGDAIFKNLQATGNLIADTFTARRGTIQEDLEIGYGLKVLGGTAQLPRTTVGGALTVGTVSIDDMIGSIDSLSGNLKLQALAQGGIDFIAGKVVIDSAGNVTIANGNLEITEGVVLGNDQIRGIANPVPSGNATITVQFPQSRASSNYAVTVTPKWLTTVAVTNKTSSGFTVTFSTPAPAGATFDWIVID